MPAKRLELSKHGVSFAEAMTVFHDPLETMIPDPAHSAAELRFVSVGLSEADRVLVVNMNQKVNSEEDAQMLPEYDFTHGVRGMHHEAYKAGTNVIFLEPDLARIFKDSASVNRVLRLLLSLAKENVSPDRPA